MIQPFKGRIINLARPVWVYRNLHARTNADRWSLQQGGLVVAHADTFWLEGVDYIVRPAAAERATKVRTVCAFVRGFLVPAVPHVPPEALSATYSRTLRAFVTLSPEGRFDGPPARPGGDAYFTDVLAIIQPTGAH